VKSSNKTLALIPSIFLASSLVSAQSVVEHETVVVTANRTATTVDNTISSVIIFTEEDIKASGAQSLTGLLATSSGLKVSSNGGRGQRSSLFVRGTNSNHVLVLIDGVKVGSATTGSVDYDALPLAQIERIEVVKGSRSSLYGSEAIGGIVQIFTKKGAQDTKLGLSLTAGTDDTIISSGNVAGAVGALSYAAGISAETTSGYNVFADQTSSRYDSDSDGYEELSGSLQLAYQIGPDTELSAFFLQSDGELEFDGDPDNAEKTQRVTGVGATFPVSSDWYVDLKVGQSEDLVDNFKGDVASNYIDTKRQTVQLVNDVALTPALSLVAGADYEKEEIKSSNAYGATERETTAGYAQLLFNRGAHDYEISARYDDNQVFENSKTGSVGYGYSVNDALRVTAAFSTAFKAPTFNDLYWPAGPYGAGNPDLLPEKSRTTELGLRYKQVDIEWSIAAYNTVVKNLIDWSPNPTPAFPFRWTPSNVAEADIRGFDISVNKQVNEHLRAGLEFALVNAFDRSGGANDGNRLGRRPKTQSTFNLTYAKDAWTHAADLIVAGSSYDTENNTNTLDGYRLVNLRSTYAVNDVWSMGASIENVFDKGYQTAKDYIEPGRTVLVSVNYAN